jgi:hypothetical protein
MQMPFSGSSASAGLLPDLAIRTDRTTSSTEEFRKVGCQTFSVRSTQTIWGDRRTGKRLIGRRLVPVRWPGGTAFSNVFAGNMAGNRWQFRASGGLEADAISRRALGPRL